MILLSLFDKLFEQIFAGNVFFDLPVNFLYILFFEFGVLGNEVRHDLEACDLRVANGTAQEGLVELLRDEFRNDLLTRTVNSVVLIE